LFHQEVYVDRDRKDWPRDSDGALAITSKPLNLRTLLNEYEEVWASRI